MPFINGYDAILPDQNAQAPGGKVKKEIAYAGFAIDGRVLTNADIADIYMNTRDHFLSKGVIAKVKIGHFQEGGMFGGPGEEELKGFVSRLEIHEKPSDEGRNLSLYADLHMYPEVYSQWKEGRFPEVSIGNFTSVKDRDGNDISQIIDHVALLGAGRAALPESEHGKILGLFNIMRKFFSNKNQIEEVINVDDKQKTEVLEAVKAIDRAVKAIETRLTSKETGDPLKGEQPKEQPKKADTTQGNKSTALEITSAFAKMVGEGKISPDLRSKFDSLVDTTCLEFAIGFYNDSKTNTPPEGKELQSDRNEADLSEKTKALDSVVRAMGLNYDDDKIKALAKEVDNGSN